MLLLVIFAFLAGVVTVLSPCILPLLPIILSSADGRGKQKPLGVVTGFVASFTFFTLFLSTIVGLSGISANSLRVFSIVVLSILGASLFVPQIQARLEILFGRLANLVPSGQNRTGFWGGLIIGLSLGLLWTPCVGPILASVISLAITGTVTAQALLITLAYAVGTAIPMFGIMLAGSTALQKVPWLVRNASRIQKAFGVLMILTAVGMLFNVDRRFQTYILTVFPGYGVGLTRFEDNASVRQALERVNQKPVEDTKIGKPMFEVAIPKGPIAPELIPGGKWFNSEPLTLSGLKGKVVVVDFWTYTCINCQRTLPYLRKWYEKYKDKGLVIIGVHSPEFEFEKDANNVGRAIQDFGLTYPIVQDNNFDTWRAYNNHYWPAKYLIDKDGYIRYTHFGEGKYDETEKVIQELLKETGATDVTVELDNPTYQVSSNTPETYLGYERIQNFASLETIVKNTLITYTAPTSLKSNQVAFEGGWVVKGEYADPQEGAKLFLNFEAKEVFLVMRSKGDLAKVRVYLDNKLQDFGEDNKYGVVSVDSDRLYKIINLQLPGRHLLRLEFEDNNSELFAFTFG